MDDNPSVWKQYMGDLKTRLERNAKQKGIELGDIKPPQQSSNTIDPSAPASQATLDELEKKRQLRSKGRVYNATEEQALAELRQLNVELGLPENDGIPMTQAQAEAELRALDEELASTPESFTNMSLAENRMIVDHSRKDIGFTDSFITGASILAQEGGRALIS